MKKVPSLIAQVIGHTNVCHYLLAPARSGGRAPPVPSPDYEVGVVNKIMHFTFAFTFNSFSSPE